MSLTILLYPFAFFLVFAIAYSEGTEHSIRRSVLIAYCAIATWIIVSTETMSLFSGIGRTGLLCAWLAFCAFLFAAIMRKNALTKMRGTLAASLRCVRATHLTWLERLELVAVLWILLFTFLGAILYAPSTHDAMTYHMTRVMLWLQNHSVNYVHAADERLNYQLPLAEYFILHLQCLSRVDWFANLVQWQAFVMSLLAASVIAKELHQPRRVQCLTVLVLSTTPNVVCQASSTQNDLFAASFILLFVAYVLRFVKNPSWQNSLLAGLSLGISLYAKGTAFLYIGILGPAFCLWALSKSKQKLHVRFLQCATIAVIGVGIVTPCFLRNLDYYGSWMPKHADTEVNYLLADTSPGEIVRSFARSCSLHLGLPSATWNTSVINALKWIFGPTFENSINTGRNVFVPFRLHEDLSGNFLHLVLWMWAIVGCGLLNLRRKNDASAPSFSTYTAIIATTAVFLFASLAWSPFRARYHVPLFCLASVSIASLLGRPSQFRMVQTLLAVVCVLGALPFLHCQSTRPLLLRPLATHLRHFGYFHVEHFPDLKDSAREIVAVKRWLEQHEVQDVVWPWRSDQRDYPFFKLLGSPLQDSGIRLHKINPRKLSSCDLPLILVSKKDTPVPQTYPFEVVCETKLLRVYDRRLKARQRASLPLEWSFERPDIAVHTFNFHVPEEKGIWLGNNAAIQIDLEALPKHELVAEFNWSSTPVPGTHTLQISSAGILLHEQTIQGGHRYSTQFTIPKIAVDAHTNLLFFVSVDGIVSPTQAGIGYDGRDLLMFLKDFRIRELSEKEEQTESFLAFSFAADIHRYNLVSGFSEIESSGVWSLGDSATLEIFLPPCFQSKPIEIELLGNVFLCPSKQRQRVSVELGSKEVFSTTYSVGAKPPTLCIQIPAEMTRQNLVRLTIRHPETVSPSELGHSSDVRRLGFLLKNAVIRILDQTGEL